MGLFKMKHGTGTPTSCEDGTGYLDTTTGQFVIGVGSNLIEVKDTSATTQSFAVTLSSTGWEQQIDDDGNTIYIYTLPQSLYCGKDGDIPPLISWTSNYDDYNKIESAETFNEGIKFVSNVKIDNSIDIIIIDTIK